MTRRSGALAAEHGAPPARAPLREVAALVGFELAVLLAAAAPTVLGAASLIAVARLFGA